MPRTNPATTIIHYFKLPTTNNLKRSKPATISHVFKNPLTKKDATTFNSSKQVTIKITTQKKLSSKKAIYRQTLFKATKLDIMTLKL